MKKSQADRQAQREASLGQKIGRKSKAKLTPSRSEWLKLRPLRNPQLEWHEEDGEIILVIKRAHNWKTRLLNLLFPLPEEKRVALDKIGADVWRLLDGQNTVGQIVKTLAGKYQIEPREAELSLQQYFKELGRRGYVGFWIEENSATP
jgi:hypothetical protein